MKSVTLTITLLFLLIFPLFADEKGKTAEKALFDGATLEGWVAQDMSYWSIEEGAITAKSSQEHPCTKNQFLVWQGGDIGNFILRLQFRVDGGEKANSGIQIRSQQGKDGHVIGYQVDISQPEAPWLGAIYDEHGRKMLAERGEKTVVKADGSLEKQSVAETAAKAIAAYRAGGWNEYEIQATGNHIVVKLNGHITAEVIDEQESEREMSGLLALQLHSGPPMTVQFREISLTPLHAK